MDQFRQVGEVLGGIKALMVLKHDISINQRQCSLLLNIFSLAFETISEEIRHNLRLEDKNIKWKALERPLRELHRIFKEGELYIRYCLDIKEWWGKALSLHQNKDCVEFHIHNLLLCFTIVIEALETAGEISGPDQDDMQKRRLVLMRKYDGDSNDLKVFQWKYGKQYLVSREICNQLSSAWREDKWILLEAMKEKKSLVPAIMGKHEQRLADYLIKKLNGSEPIKGKLLPAWILIGAKDYQVKRRLGSGGSHCKEIHWFGESFALKNFFGEISEQLQDEISMVISLSHPNIVQYLCGFFDKERKEGYLVMELMNKCLASHIKENCGQRKRIPFSIPVAVDVMLQIARGMEYLHSQKIYHGDLNPSNILLKLRHSASQEGYFYAKVTGFGLPSMKSFSRTNSNQNEDDPIIWHAPEVLAEKEQHGSKCSSSKYTEKADVYSFGMVCFEILSGKVPFEEGHLQEDKMSRNIRAGERPLFPYTCPKYLMNLTRKCWQAEPAQRPSFSSICRILRYIKKCLVINPEHGQPESPPPLVDYSEIESGYSKRFPGDSLGLVSQIPFQMFSYKLVEREKTYGGFKDKIWDLGIDTRSIWGAASVSGEEIGLVTEDPFLGPIDQRSVCSEKPLRRVSSKTSIDRMSFRSEFLWGKMDQRSVGSPDKNFLSVAFADQGSTGSETQERKIVSGEAKLFLETENDQISGHLETGEGKNSAAKATDGKPFPSETKLAKQNSVGSKITKRSTSSPGKRVDQFFCEVEEKKTLSRSVSMYSRTPDRKFLPTIASDSEFSSICSETTEKRRLSKKSSDVRSVRSKIPERKGLAKRNVVVAKTNKGPGSKIRDSPRSSPTWTPHGHSPKSRALSREPPGHSPKSPARSQEPQEHSPESSPKSPELSPCSRCSRMNRECRVPSAMSPSRRPRSLISDSERA